MDWIQNKTYFQTYGVANRYDSAELQFIKRVLQTGLPEKCRTEVTGRLFRKYVTEDEASFATELYMTPDQLMCLKRNGMSIGSHGYNHVWMDTLTPATQETEIDSSLEFLGNMGSDLNRWSFNYPYGAYNESLVSLLKSKGCGFGLTTKVGIADLDADDSLTLPRLDTNDLPKDLDAGPNEWTMRVIV